MSYYDDSVGGGNGIGSAVVFMVTDHLLGHTTSMVCYNIGRLTVPRQTCFFYKLVFYVQGHLYRSRW